MSISTVHLTSTFDSMTKYTVEKCVRAKDFIEFLSEIEEKRPETVVLMGSLICKNSMFIFFTFCYFEYTGEPMGAMRLIPNENLNNLLHRGT